MSVAAQLTIDEFLKLERMAGKQELVDGELIEMPPAKQKHGVISKRVLRRLEAVLGESRVWHEMGYRLGGHWLQPDLSVSWPEQAIADGWYQNAPMVAIEIISPANTAEMMERRAALLLEYGSAEVWIIYPKTRSMVVYLKDGGIERTTAAYHSESLGLDLDVRGVTE